MKMDRGFVSRLDAEVELQNPLACSARWAEKLCWGVQWRSVTSVWPADATMHSAHPIAGDDAMRIDAVEFVPFPMSGGGHPYSSWSKGYRSSTRRASFAAISS